MEIQLGAEEAAAFLRRPSTSLAAFRGLLGADSGPARALGHLERPGVAYAAFDLAPAHADAKAVQRDVALAGETLAIVDLVVAAGEHHWNIRGSGDGLYVASLTPDLAAGEAIFVHAFSLGQRPEIAAVDAGVDLAGLRTGRTVILFHNEPRMNRSAVAFAVEDEVPELTMLVAGLAPGSWQLWRNGWLEASPAVHPREGAICITSRPGRFFLRHLD